LRNSVDIVCPLYQFIYTVYDLTAQLSTFILPIVQNNLLKTLLRHLRSAARQSPLAVCKHD
jgi:hypothetical protein